MPVCPGRRYPQRAPPAKDDTDTALAFQEALALRPEEILIAGPWELGALTTPGQRAPFGEPA